MCVRGDVCEEDGEGGGEGEQPQPKVFRCDAYLDCGTVPIVQIERAHFGNVHPEATMDSRARDTQCYPQVDACPLYICKCVHRHKVHVCDVHLNEPPASHNKVPPSLLSQ